jgi:hypothetical protein
MDAVRSTWEESIEEHIRGKYPGLRIESNNRSIIPSRRTHSFNLEIDIFIPQLCLGIEANGEPYHDHEEYLDDVAHGTAHSDEMYKENYCERVGIQLVHVWSFEDLEVVHSKIDEAIERRLADPTIEEWHPARASTWASLVEYFSTPLGCLFIYLGYGLMSFGGLFSAYFLVGILSGYDLGPSSGSAPLLRAFFMGAIGVCLSLLGHFVGDYGEARRAPAAPGQLVRVMSGCLGTYISLILIAVGAFGVFVVFITATSGEPVSQVSGLLATAVPVGVIGLLLSRFLNKGSR